MHHLCPVCHRADGRTFFEWPAAPVSIGVQWPSAAEARASARGDLRLAFCGRCGFIWNQAFDPGRLEYSQRYDNALDFSPVFQAYARQLAERLIATYDLRNKAVVELGCGKGHFLALLCERGGNRGVGFDPSYEGARVESPAAGRITYIADFYGEKYTNHQGDLICCRHVLEHIADPTGFLAMVRRTLGERRSAVVYFEVPNVRFILNQHSIWDIIYEHCNYFSRESLAGIFRRCGFEVLRLEETYGGQFLGLDARLAAGAAGPAASGEDGGELAAAVGRFGAEVERRCRAWRERLAEWRRAGRRAVVWGGGAKAVSFLNLLQIDEEIPYVVDINPHKQGRYLPGTGQRIVPPEFLREYRPEVVALMNPIYHHEVEQQLRGLGVAAEILEV